MKEQQPKVHPTWLGNLTTTVKLGSISKYFLTIARPTRDNLAVIRSWPFWIINQAIFNSSSRSIGFTTSAARGCERSGKKLQKWAFGAVNLEPGIKASTKLKIFWCLVFIFKSRTTCCDAAEVAGLYERVRLLKYRRKGPNSSSVALFVSQYN